MLAPINRERVFRGGVRAGGIGHLVFATRPYRPSIREWLCGCIVSAERGLALLLVTPGC
jgi:hypothetical protein